MENIPDNNLFILNELATKCLSKEDYAIFLTIMQKIRDRSLTVLNASKKQSEVEHSLIKYSHDIDLNLQIKLFQNNTKGERIKLSDYSEIPFMVKVPMGKDPKETIDRIYNAMMEATE